MPEGHTIHRAARDHAAVLAGKTLRVASPGHRFDPAAAAVDGRVLDAVEAWGKHLFYVFSGRRVLHVHLGLDGRFRPVRVPGAAPGRAAIRMSSDAAGFDLHDPKTCQAIDAAHQLQVIRRLGPDPIRSDSDGGAVLPKLAASTEPMGAALLDQSIVAGIGNIYRSEILFVRGMHPLRPAASINAGEWQAMWHTTVELLRRGVEAGRVVTVDKRAVGRREVYVYKQRLCVRCGSPVRWLEVGGRPAYACETCQPPWG